MIFDNELVTLYAVKGFCSSAREGYITHMCALVKEGGESLYFPSVANVIIIDLTNTFGLLTPGPPEPQHIDMQITQPDGIVTQSSFRKVWYLNSDGDGD